MIACTFDGVVFALLSLQPPLLRFPPCLFPSLLSLLLFLLFSDVPAGGDFVDSFAHRRRLGWRGLRLSGRLQLGMFLKLADQKQ